MMCNTIIQRSKHGDAQHTFNIYMPQPSNGLNLYLNSVLPLPSLWVFLTIQFLLLPCVFIYSGNIPKLCFKERYGLWNSSIYEVQPREITVSISTMLIYLQIFEISNFVQDILWMKQKNFGFNPLGSFRRRFIKKRLWMTENWRWMQSEDKSMNGPLGQMTKSEVGRN